MIDLKLLKKVPWTENSLAFLALLCLFPSPYHTIAELDASWQAVLEHAFFNQWQFGKDLIFTGGPLSFLYAPTSIGYFPKTQVVLEASVLFMAIFAIINAVKTERLWVKIFVFLCIFCGASSSRDSIYLISITALSFGILNSRNDLRSIILPIIFIAILSLMKFTLTLLGTACLITLAVTRMWQKQKKPGFQIIGIYLISVCAIWMMIGQSLWNLPSFIGRSWSLSQGYEWGMQLPEQAHFFKYLIGILLLASLPIFIWTIHNRKKATSWAVLVISALSIYVSWKTGITRFGTHITFFLQAAALVPLLILPFIKKKQIPFAWMGLNFVVCVWAFVWLLPTNKDQLKTRAITQATFGLKFIATAGGEVRKFADLVPYVKSSHTLHRIKAAIGEATVDVLYYHHGILLLNELNYVPRPTLQNYAAFNGSLAEWNLQHMQNNPPQFILCRDGVIDERYPTVDDNLFFKEVIDKYQPVLTEEDYILLERKESAIPYRMGEPILQRQVPSGQNIDISEFSEHTLWLKVKYEPSMAHKLAGKLYKPEILMLHVTTTNGDSKNYRLIGANLENGFLLNPTLDSIKEIENLLNSKTPKTTIKDFSINSVPGHTPFPTLEFEVELYKLVRNK